MLLFEGTFKSFFRDKKSKRSHKIVEIKAFLTLLLNGSGSGSIAGSGSIPLTNGGPKTCGSGGSGSATLLDPDPPDAGPLKTAKIFFSNNVVYSFF
jgi:hypothetical protein